MNIYLKGLDHIELHYIKLNWIARHGIVLNIVISFIPLQGIIHCFVLISPQFAQILKYFALSCDCKVAALRNSALAPAQYYTQPILLDIKISSFAQTICDESDIISTI